jgi:glutamate carboxypeptidase
MDDAARDTAAPLRWIDAQRDEMTRLLRAWAEVNSGSRNVAGLARLRESITDALATLGGATRVVTLEPDRVIDARGRPVEVPLGKLVSVVKRPGAPVRVLLNIHYDTVFGPDSAFQKCTMLDDDTLCGPGVVDAKGGLVVMLTALRAFEQSPLAEKLGWEVIINPDEEIGSPGSAPVLREAASRNAVGLLFEPAMPDGSLVGARKGSGNFTVVVRGRAAHAGRDFALGRSAIVATAELITRIDAAQRDADGVTINCGHVDGGGALNIVPDLAIARFNARAQTPEQARLVEARFAQVVDEIRRRDGITAELHGGFHAPPKVLDERTGRLMDHILAAARELGLNLSHVASGGASDGNKLAAAGLPVVDTMGPVGGNLHNEREYVKLSSLTERAKLTALVLMKLASGAVTV